VPAGSAGNAPGVERGCPGTRRAPIAVARQSQRWLDAGSNLSHLLVLRPPGRLLAPTAYPVPANAWAFTCAARKRRDRCNDGMDSSRPGCYQW
jgi:hypothetical protein